MLARVASGDEWLVHGLLPVYLYRISVYRISCRAFRRMVWQTTKWRCFPNKQSGICVPALSMRRALTFLPLPPTCRRR